MLDQVQAFLPQMAQANEKLRKEMAVAPAGHFNIENIDETSGNIIQMDVALFEMNQSEDSKEDDNQKRAHRTVLGTVQSLKTTTAFPLKSPSRTLSFRTQKVAKARFKFWTVRQVKKKQ